MQRCLCLALIMTSLCAAGLASAQDAGVAPEKPPAITIIGKPHLEGEGCPAGTYTVSDIVSSNGSQNLTIRFDAFEAVVGPDVYDHVLSCLIRFRLKTPAGWRILLTDVIWYTRVSLPETGMKANLRTTYYWSGRPITAHSAEPLSYEGPAEESFRWEEKVDVAQWSDCVQEEELVAVSRLSVTTNDNFAEGSMRVKSTEVNADSSQTVPLPEPGRSVELRFRPDRCKPTATRR